MQQGACLQGDNILAGLGQGDVLLGGPGAAAVGRARGQRARLAGVRRLQHRVEAEHHAAVGQVLLPHARRCTSRQADRQLSRPWPLLYAHAPSHTEALECFPALVRSAA